MEVYKKQTERVIRAVDQAHNKFVKLEEQSTDEAEIVAYRCYYTNLYEVKLYIKQMQKEIDRLKAEHDEQIVPIWDDTDKCYCCGKCGKAIVFLWRKYDGYRENYKYCTSCGQAIDWKAGEQE